MSRRRTTQRRDRVTAEAARRRAAAERKAQITQPPQPQWRSVSGLTYDEIELLASEDPDDRENRLAHGFTLEDDFDDDRLLCRNGCGFSYPEIVAAKIGECLFEGRGDS